MDNVPLPAKALADLKAFREQMKAFYNYIGKDGAMGFNTPSDASTTDPEIRALDKLSLADWVAQQGWAPEVATFWDKYCQSALGGPTAKVSAWAAINFFGAEFQPTMTRPGGNAWVAQLLAGKVGADHMQTKSMVVAIDQTADEVHLGIADGENVKTVRARTAIFAAPHFTARRLIAGFDPNVYAETAQFDYTPYIVANVHVSRMPQVPKGYDYWLHTESFITDFIVADWAGLDDPATAPEDRANTLTLYCPVTETGGRFLLSYYPFEFWEKRILADLDKVLPGVTDTITGIDIYRWGHAMIAATPGFVFGQARANAQKMLGRLAFAGTELDGLPAFENAVASGIRAATEVKAKL